METWLTSDAGAAKQTLYLKHQLTEAFGDMFVCYILDGILILYGIILTVLYCRLKMSPSSDTSASHPQKQPADGGIYAGLTAHTSDTYESIRMDKKPIV
ncbi:Fc receptor, IgE, high affinity I, gamma polypeptide like [Mastacembelus armatus]|uniref:Fc receptor, IgE, high affinity I, gamma polypeptide like n=1 Tax=Mastacembelus armatus TaxID=205130 RepID=UPI000E45B43F|nr:high affinity immunoglobulin epsilon receptor subunit gamma [Mastacembelus armatus]